MPKLIIILGKNIGRDAMVWHDTNKAGVLIGYPELSHPAPGVVLPLHPDLFVPQTVEHIAELLTLGCKDVYLWTLSEYLVSWIAQDVEMHRTYWREMPEVRLYEDDNQSFRRYGIAFDGFLCDVGDGQWPYGWFMPSA